MALPCLAQPRIDRLALGDNARTAAPAEVGGSHKVAALNVLSYFTTLGERGAIDADVVGLIEWRRNDVIFAWQHIRYLLPFPQRAQPQAIASRG